jgi:RecA-family ATPase
MAMFTASDTPGQDRNARLSDDHMKQILRRGLTSNTATVGALWSGLSHQVEELLGFNAHSGGIVLPYRHPLTGEIVLNRVRPDRPPIIGGKGAKYLSPKGAENRLYFPPDSAAWLCDPEVPLIFTEGEFKVLLASQYGLCAIGSVGVWGWRGGKNAFGKTGPIPDLDLIDWRDRVVTIVFDSDAATNEKVRAARDALAQELYRRGARLVYAINLPDDGSGEKVGLDDFLHVNGLEAFFDLDAEEIPSPYPRVKVWTLPELRAANLERPAPIVPGWGIRRAGKVIITGAGGRGKSTLLLQLACNLAAERPLLGHPQLAVYGGSQRVLLYMAEDPLSEVRFRLLKQIEELGYGPEMEHRIHILEFGDRRPPLLTDEWALQILADHIRQHQATIAILDPLVTLHDRDENSNPQMRAVLDAVSPLGEETGCVFMLAHHEPKSPENNGAAARGASAIRDWCRTMLRLTSHGDDDDDQVRRYSLALDKANYGGSVWNLTLERKHDSYIFTPAEEQGAVTPLQVWETIGPEQRWFTDVLTELTLKYKTSEATAARAIKRAQDLGLVEVGEATNPQSGRRKKTLARGKGKSADDE